MAYHEMTPFGLARRATWIVDGLSIGNETGTASDDDRNLSLYFEHEDAEFDCANPNAWSVIGTAARLIGVTLDTTTLDRDETTEMFGLRWVSKWETQQTQELSE